MAASTAMASNSSVSRATSSTTRTGRPVSQISASSSPNALVSPLISAVKSGTTSSSSVPWAAAHSASACFRSRGRAPKGKPITAISLGPSRPPSFSAAAVAAMCADGPHLFSTTGIANLEQLVVGQKGIENGLIEQGWQIRQISGGSIAMGAHRSVARLDHAVTAMISAVDHLQLAAGLIPEQIEVVIDQFQLPAGLLQIHRWHRKIFSPHAGIG